MQEQLNVRFDGISFGHLVNTTTYRPEQAIQSAFHAVSASGYLKEERWSFIIHQSGFRKELLPSELEMAVKNGITQVLSSYLLKLMQATENDFFKRPQLMISIEISSNQAKIQTHESK